MVKTWLNDWNENGKEQRELGALSMIGCMTAVRPDVAAAAEPLFLRVLPLNNDLILVEQEMVFVEMWLVTLPASCFQET